MVEDGSDIFFFWHGTATVLMNSQQPWLHAQIQDSQKLSIAWDSWSLTPSWGAIDILQLGWASLISSGIWLLGGCPCSKWVSNTHEHTGSTEWNSSEVALCLEKEHPSLGEKDDRGMGKELKGRGLAVGLIKLHIHVWNSPAKWLKEIAVVTWKV